MKSNVDRGILALGLGCALLLASGGFALSQTSQSSESESFDQPTEPRSQFVWSFALSPEVAADAYRLDLAPAVMERLSRATADDLMVVDQSGRSVPFALVPQALLTEAVQIETPLRFETSRVSAQQQPRSDLTLDFEHQGARFQVRSPTTASRADPSATLRFEALLGLAEQPLPSSSDFTMDSGGRRVQIEFQTDQRLMLDCWLRSADDSGPATRRIQLAIQGDSRPRRYLGSSQVLDDELAWHMACYGSTLPDDLELTTPTLTGQAQRLHQSEVVLSPAVSPFPSSMPNAPEQWQFDVPAPYLAQSIGLTSQQSGVFSRIELRSRRSLEQPWVSRGSFDFSTLDSDSGSKLVLSARSGSRDQFWQFDAQPSLGQAPELEFTAQLDTLVFLAQGQQPWQLLVGSRSPGRNQLPAPLLTDLIQRLGPIWSWPRLELPEPERINLDQILLPPPEPFDAASYLLWLVLIVGSLAVVIMAFRLLRDPSRQRSD